MSAGGGNYSAANISSWEPTARTGDPLFRNSSDLPTGFAGVYGSSLAPNRDGLLLQSGSPGLNNGADFGIGFAGSVNSRQRPVDGAWDIGAYEGTAIGILSAPRNLRVTAQ